MEGRRRGFSLLELLVALSIVSVLSFLALPALQSARWSDEASQFTQLLSRSMAIARRRAVASAERITLCASTDQRNCLKHWRGEVSILVFTDRNRNHQLDEGDTLHLEQRLVLRHGDAYWRGSLGRSYMRFRIDGSAVEYGRYSYCPIDGNARGFRQLVVNRVGRAYLHHDGTGRTSHCSQAATSTR
jgi:type IV fimbrial biogenesis protein FimT